MSATSEKWLLQLFDDGHRSNELECSIKLRKDSLLRLKCELLEAENEIMLYHCQKPESATSEMLLRLFDDGHRSNELEWTIELQKDDLLSLKYELLEAENAIMLYHCQKVARECMDQNEANKLKWNSLYEKTIEILRKPLPDPWFGPSKHLHVLEWVNCLLKASGQFGVIDGQIRAILMCLLIQSFFFLSCLRKECDDYLELLKKNSKISQEEVDLFWKIFNSAETELLRIKIEHKQDYPKISFEKSNL